MLLVFHISILFLFSVIFSPLLPNVLSIFLFINETDVRTIIENSLPRYFIDQENYFYFNTLHICATIGIGGTTMVGTGMMLAAYLKHACGMFKIAR